MIELEYWHEEEDERHHVWYGRGPLGVVQFKAVIMPELPALPSGLVDAIFERDADGTLWMPADLSYHSPAPLYDGQEPWPPPCPLLSEGGCYWDGSSLAANPVGHEWIEEGKEDATIHRHLSSYYERVFHDKETGGFMELMSIMFRGFDK